MIELDLGLSVADVARVARRAVGVRLSAAARDRVVASRAYVERLLAEGATVYGITTGFGRFATTRIAADQVKQLQRNLLLSHAVGVGDALPDDVVRTMLVLRAQSLAIGNSGVRPAVIEGLLGMLAADVLPRVPAKGSVGASGDLAPLAHLALPLIGEGEAYVGGELLTGAEALRRAGLPVLELEAKEGLALINGTQLMTALLVKALLAAESLARHADVAAAMTVEGLMGSHVPFTDLVTRLRPHPGARTTADNMSRLLKGSEINHSHEDCGRVQDAYSLRAVTQVHGASRDALGYLRRVVEVELQSVTDNPLIFSEEEQVVSAGNFHGQPLALAADFAAIAVAELGNISERRVEQLVNPALSGLPAFLTPEGGLNSGLMVAQYTAAALVSENKVLAHPASVDSIPTSANQEDHVSMGAYACRKLLDVIDNVRQVVAVELIAAAQALDFRAPLRPSPGVAAAHAWLRERVPGLAGDRYLAPDLRVVADAIEGGSLLQAVASASGELA